MRVPFFCAFLLRAHRTAFSKLLPTLPQGAKVGIVGGGIFPRTLILMESFFPEIEITVIESSSASIKTARKYYRTEAKFLHCAYDAKVHRDFDLLIFPLAYQGDKESLYSNPPARKVLIHEWIWKKKPRSAIVSVFLLKRLILVEI